MRGFRPISNNATSQGSIREIITFSGRANRMGRSFWPEVVALAFFGIQASCALAEIGSPAPELCPTCSPNGKGDSARPEPGDGHEPGDTQFSGGDRDGPTDTGPDPGPQPSDPAAIDPFVVFTPANPSVGQSVHIAITDEHGWGNVELTGTGPCGPVAPTWNRVDNNHNGTWTWRYDLVVAAGGVHQFVFTADLGATEVVRASLTVGGAGTCPADVIIDSLAVSPTLPSAGSATRFGAVVRNIGSSPTPSGVEIGVGFKVNGTQVTYGTVPGPLQPNATVTVNTTGPAWTATAGNHVLLAKVDDINRFVETNEDNNEKTLEFLVTGTDPQPPTISRYAMNIDPVNPAGAPTSAALKAANVRWVRIEYKQYKGFSFFDPVIAGHRAAGLGVLLILDYMAPNVGKPGSDASQAAWDSYLPEFIAAVDAVAVHYGNNVDAWQIWNEPDLLHPGQPYDPGVPAATYGRMLRDAVNTIRGHSTRPIITGGLASGNPNYLTQAKNAVGGLTVDAVAVHPYGQRAPDNWPDTSWGFGNMSSLFNNYLVFGKPLWVTEIGVSTTDLELQAQYLENVYTLVKTRYPTSVPIVFWFCWSDGMVANFGILDSSGNAKPAYNRYQSVAAQP